MKRTVFIILIMSILALAACAKEKAEPKKGGYLAKVGSSTITQADFDAQFETLPEYAQKMFEDRKGKERFLDELIKKELMYQEALKRGLDKKPDFRKKLKEFKKLSLISELFSDEIVSKAQVSDKEIREFYENNRARFTPVGQIRASHILVNTKQEADSVLERLKKGERFEDIAKETSIDKASAKNGGDLGYFSKGQMVPEFEKAASDLKIGELSSPVKTPFGWHIIKLVDKKKGDAVEFDRVKDMIMQKLSGDKQKEVFDDYVAKLKKKYRIKINSDALSASSKELKTGEKPETLPGQQKELTLPEENQPAAKQADKPENAGGKEGK